MARRRRGSEEPAADERDLGPPADPESVARTILLNKLTGQARSRHELSDALAARNVPEEVAACVLDRFEQVGLIDDRAFAAAWVESRQSRRGLSRRALAFELRRKGIAEAVINDSIDTIEPEDERALARGLVERKLRSTRALDRQSRFRRLTAVLARKGYPPGLCAAVVREAIAADEVATDAPSGVDLDDVLREDAGID